LEILPLRMPGETMAPPDARRLEIAIGPVDGAKPLACRVTLFAGATFLFIMQREKMIEAERLAPAT
jgi:hypothetical protein